MSSSPHTLLSRIRRLFLRLFFVAGASFLLLLLVAQVMLLVHGSWQVPSPLLSLLDKQLDDHGLEIDYQRLGVRPPAQLTFEGLEVRRRNHEETWFAADVGRVDFSLLQLLQGKLEIEEISLYGGAAFCPSSLSPTGGRETVLDRTHATIIPIADGWNVYNLNGRFQNIHVTASGALPHLPERDGEPVKWEEALGEIIPGIIRERHTFQRAKEPRVHLQLSPSGKAGLNVTAEFRAEEIDAPERFRVLRPRVATTWTYDGTHWTGKDTSVEARAVTWDSQVTARNVRGELYWRLPEPSTPPFPAHGDFTITELEHAAGSFLDLRTKLSFENRDVLTTEFFALFQNAPIEGTAKLNWRTGTGDLTATSRINPTPLLQHELARELGLRRDLFFHEAPFARGTARVEGWRIAEAAGHAFVRQADIDGVFMNRASARAELRRDGRFVVPELVLAYKDFEVSGSYEMDLATRAYRFLFKGSVRPLHISGWFEDWWTNLWQEFQFPHAPLRGDLDIHGVLGDTNQVKLAGTVRAEDFFLRGVHFEGVDGGLFALHGYLDMFDITVRRKEGAAAGAFRYWMSPDTGDFAAIEFESESTVDPTEMGRIFGDAGREIVFPFRFTEPPRLSLSGAVYSPLREEKSRVTLVGKTAAPLAYHGLPLDWLSVEILIDGDEWNLRQLDAGLAGGEATGSVRKWPDGVDDRLEFSLLMLNLDLPKALDAIAGWREEAGIEKLEAGGRRNVKGLVDMYVEASGHFGDFQSFSGDGGIQVTDADLAEVHLLGILSRLLSATPLGFTSLSFTEADTRFRLERENIFFPDMRLTGPSSQIRATGEYLIDEEELDFSVQLHLLKESRIPFLRLLLSPVLEPLAHAMEIRLTGSLDDPQWRFLLGPRNILSGMSSPLELKKSSAEED